MPGIDTRYANQISEPGLANKVCEPGASNLVKRRHTEPTPSQPKAAYTKARTARTGVKLECEHRVTQLL